MSKYWNLDQYLAATIAAHLREFARLTSSRPMEYTDESWDAKLKSIAIRLESYSTNKLTLDFDREKELTDSAKEALHELADIFPSLWD